MGYIAFGLGFSGIILFYVMIIRPVLVNAPAFSKAFAAETSYVQQFRTKLVGFKTTILARLTAFAGIFAGVYDYFLPFATGQDWSPITAKLPTWTLPVGLMALGALVEWARKATANPPQVITQDLGDGTQKVVGLVAPPK